MKKIYLVVLLLSTLFVRLHAADSLLITEFLASNAGPLADEDGDYSDWIEIHNAGTVSTNIGGWYLTDNAASLTKWQFPATNLPPNGYLIVFASGKDRRVPGRPLHTSFSLNTSGEYLGLIAPDGTNVISAFAPKYPAQAARVSYGTPLQQTLTMLVATGATARVRVPLDDTLGGNWIVPEFDDSAWPTASTGIGYETDGQGPFTPQVIGDSVVDFSGKQGSNNWYYGYWDKKSDGNGVYSDIDMSFFPNAAEAYGANNYWNGTNWDWFNGHPPFTQISATGAQPNANNGDPQRADHWTVRRYISEANGPLKITGRVTHTSDWVYVTATGVAANSAFYVYLTAAGEGYIDDMKLVAGAVPGLGSNLLPNGDFETPLTGPWTVSANHAASAIVTNVVHGGNGSLHIVADVGGTTQASAIWQTLSAPALTVGDTYSLSYWYKPGTNNAPLVTRFSGNWIQVSPAFCGDGVMARIFVDGAEVFQQVASVNSFDYNITVPASFGSRVDFMLDPRADDLCDSVTFTAQIETTDPGNSIVADSVADWSFAGTQGEKNWFYGYYNRTADAGGIYQASDFITFPRDNGPQGPSNYWTGALWDRAVNVAPWDEIGQTAMHPNGINNGEEHWVIRRWVSEVSGRITVDWTLAKANLNGSGVTGRVLHNGVQKDIAVIAGNNGAGVNRSITITNVQVGDFIDIALDPTGVGGATDDGSDGSTMTVVVRGAPSLTAAIASNIQGAMKDVNATAYVRIPFNVVDPAVINFLTLRMKYDDGFVAYLNGVTVAFRNAPQAPEIITWNSPATTSRLDDEVNQWEEFDLTSFAGLLHAGTNILAFHAMNSSAGDSDFLLLPELRALTISSDPIPAYFSAPSPGAANGAGSTNLGPIVVDAGHAPETPFDNENVQVTALVAPTFNPVTAVQMTYRIMYSNEVTIAMLDDGLHGDGAAGDGVYGATIPADASNPGQMIRYFITATDTRANRTRVPSFLNALNSPEYLGTIVYLEQTNNLPVLHWFIQNPTSANTTTGGRGSIYFNGQFRDNVKANLHGQSSSGFNTLKKSYNFDMNPGETLRVLDGDPKVDDFNLLTTFADKSHLRNMINYNTYTDSGTPAHFAFAVRVQQNGTFFAVYNFVENGDENYLQRIGFDVNGALYKMYNSAENTTGVEKKTRKTENNADLQDLITGASVGSVAARQTYVADNMDVPGVINFLAVKAVTSDHDCCHKNYYFYRDTPNTGEWVPLSWDADLSFGRIWSSGPTYFDDVNYTNASWLVGGNTVMGIFFDTSIPKYRQMYMRRVRTLTDRFLGVFGTTNSYYDQRIEEQKALIRADAALDFAKWASWGTSMTMDQNANQIRTNYIPGRRAWLSTAQPEVPASQSSNVVVNLLAFDFNPSSGNQAQEFISITNPNNFSVDISDWKIAGGVGFTFRGGTVLPPNSAAYVTPNKAAFRARTSGPRGGQGLLVLGPYDGQLSARGESLSLIDERGRLVSSNGFVGAPSLVQQYLRITEVMYHPAAPASGPYVQDDFEYLELKNIGPVAIPLSGVHFTNGIDFAFSVATTTNLNAGQTLILARNPAAFAARYPGVTSPVFAFGGTLDNNGETIRVDDAVGEKILDFAYNNSWYPMTDGNGFSLVIVDENAAFSTWGDKAAWRPSGEVNGSPGAVDPAPVVVGAVLVNEVLAHTDFPTVDAIELYNPTTNAVDVGDWWISDDFSTPRKYRIPAPRIIAAGGFAVFTESDFNIGGLGFSFSSQGDEAYVFSGNASGNLSGYYHGYQFGASENPVSFGRHLTSTGGVHFVAQSSNTLGAANAVPKTGPIIISEIMYHPPELNGADNAQDEFLELQNLSTNSVPLYSVAFPTNRWKLDDGINYTFSTNDVIPARGYLLVVNFNPTNAAMLDGFRAKFGVPANVAVVGPYSGKLDNDGESIELYRPDNPDLNGTPFILVERVHYADRLPWDGGADGFGPSLQRRVVTDYGNEATNWFAALPNAGRSAGPGQAPVITQQPQNIIMTQGGTANVSLAVSGTNPLGYQWQYNGATLSGQTNSTLLLTNALVSQSGLYSVVVFNDAGVAFSSNALVTVRPLPVFTLQPANQNVLPGTNVSMTVSVAGTGTLYYQWRFNGADIAGATSASYSFTNAQLVNHGNYSVAVTDDVSTLVSTNAFVFVLIKPGIVTQPVAQTVLQAGTAVFSVVATGAPPLYYRWLRNGALWASNTFPNLTITNCQSNGTFRVTVGNLAGTIGSSPAGGVALTVLRDFDGDGMADIWETNYPGFSTNNAADALQDFDGDGMINRDEFVAGTNPTDALSLLKIILSTTNTSALQFVAQTNIGYTVQSRTNLSSGFWNTISNITSSPQVRTVAVEVSAPPGGGERYYRIVTPILP